MQTAEWALVISVASAIVASLSLGWNIYRDVVFRAQCKLTIGIVRFFNVPGISEEDNFVSIGVTNLGPGPLHVQSLTLKRSTFWSLFYKKERLHAMLNHDWENPASAKLPRKLEIGESATYPLPFNKECFLHVAWTHVGVNDSFHRTHWVPRKQLQKCNESYIKDFGVQATRHE
jgi:hypothetical protein